MAEITEITEKAWFEIEVDGKVLGVMEDGVKARREIERTKNLLGITIRPAAPESLIKYRAVTKIPSHVFRRFSLAWDDYQRQQRKKDCNRRSGFGI